MFTMDWNSLNRVQWNASGVCTRLQTGTASQLRCTLLSCTEVLLMVEASMQTACEPGKCAQSLTTELPGLPSLLDVCKVLTQPRCPPPSHKSLCQVVGDFYPSSLVAALFHTVRLADGDSSQDFYILMLGLLLIESCTAC